jgi:hypothetical protein
MGSEKRKEREKEKKERKRSWRHAETLITIKLTPSKRSQGDKSNDIKEAHQW